MAEGKPYRYGLIAAGLCVAAVGLFVMTQEQPHVYAAMCALGVTMVGIGTAWSLCQCYPKVILSPKTQETSREDVVFTAARHAEALPSLCGQKSSSSRLPLTSRSCPALHLV